VSCVTHMQYMHAALFTNARSAVCNMHGKSQNVCNFIVRACPHPTHRCAAAVTDYGKTMQRCYALFWPRPTHCHTRQRSDLRLLDDDLDLGVPHLIEQDELGCPPCAVWTTAVKGSLDYSCQRPRKNEREQFESILCCRGGTARAHCVDI
jgi:hypothetical protein